MAATGCEAQEPCGGSYSVYLRIKPADVNRITDEVTAFKVQGNSVVVVAPRKRDGMQREEFEFTKVFRPSCSQMEIFESVVKPRLEEFMDGEDSLIFSYGTTNSGKSYTMQGTPNCPGIIPRVLRTVFASIGNVVDTDHTLKPLRNKAATFLNERLRKQILNAKNLILKTVGDSNGKGKGEVTISGTLPEDIQFDDEAPLGYAYHEDSVVGVWLSFYEIYNEALHDLLSLDENPVPLNVVRDQEDDSFYPEGLTQVPVVSWEEAFNVYRAGKKNLKVRSTLMNRQSSRSHCVFTIKLLLRPASDPTSFYDLCNLTFCDLAGNERVSHLDSAVSSADKKETLKINSSLLALNKCFVMLRSNQGRAATNMPSFRDSKLTMVFKKFLTRRGKLSMLANISQDPEMLASTVHILKMTAVAVSTQVDVPKPQVAVVRRRFSLAHGGPTQTPLSCLAAVPETEILVTPQPSTHLEAEVAALKAKLAAKTAELEKLNVELMSANKYIKDLENGVDQLTARERDELAYSERQDSARKALEETVRKLHRRELEYLSRLHNYQSQNEELFERLADAYDIESEDHGRIVDLAIRKFTDAVRMAREEIGELGQQNEDLWRRVEETELRLAVANGQLTQSRTELELEQEMNASLRAHIEELQRRLEASSVCTDVGGPNVDQESVSGSEGAAEEGHFSRLPVRAHNSLRWLSDDESSPRVPPRGAATSAKKKRLRKKKDVPPPVPELAPRRATRRRLLPRAAGTDHLDANATGIDTSSMELQPSPNTFMRSTRQRRK